MITTTGRGVTSIILIVTDGDLQDAASSNRQVWNILHLHQVIIVCHFNGYYYNVNHAGQGCTR